MIVQHENGDDDEISVTDLHLLNDLQLEVDKNIHSYKNQVIEMVDTLEEDRNKFEQLRKSFRKFEKKQRTNLINEGEIDNNHAFGLGKNTIAFNDDLNEDEVEESTSLELPMLEKNLPVLATLTSVGTLTALLGTVMGMIKAFSALATAGAPDQSQLANLVLQ